MTWTIPTIPRKKLTAASLHHILSISVHMIIHRSSPINSQIVLRLDNQTPPRPDQSRSSQGTVLRKRQLLRRTGKIRNTGQHDRPLHDGRPEVHRLEADGAVPHALEEPGLGRGALGRGALPALATGVAEGLRAGVELCALEEGARGAENGGGGC